MCRIQRKISEYRMIIHSKMSTHFDKSKVHQSDLKEDSDSKFSEVSVKLIADSKIKLSMKSIGCDDNAEDDATEKIMKPDYAEFSFTKLPISAELLAKKGICLTYLVHLKPNKAIQSNETFDSKGTFHKLKMNRDTSNQPTQISYQKAKPQKKESTKPFEVITLKNINFGPRGSANLNLKPMMPFQEDLDNYSSDIISERAILSMNTVPLKKEASHKEVNYLAMIEDSRNKILKLEIQWKYLRSLLSIDYDEDRLQYATELLMRHFVKTPRLSSTGKNTSFYTDFAGKSTTQMATARFTHATHPNSDEGRLYVI